MDTGHDIDTESEEEIVFSMTYESLEWHWDVFWRYYLFTEYNCQMNYEYTSSG